MIAKIRLLLNPETREEMQNRIILVLIGAISVIFIALAISRFNDVRGSAYFSDGDVVLKLSGDNKLTFYKVMR